MIDRPTLLFVESDVIVRHPIAQYLRDCGYRVVEVSDTEEGEILLKEDHVSIDVALLHTNGDQTTFALAHWIRANRPDTSVVIAASVDAAAHKAGELCKESPAALSIPYEPTRLVDIIKRMRSKQTKDA